MFCGECGKQGTGKFCWNCGARLHAPEGSERENKTPAPDIQKPQPATDWKNEVSYDKLMAIPEVRDRLAKEKPLTVRLTGEAFVESFGKIISSPISLVPVMTILQDVYSRIGIHTGKTRSQRYGEPVGQVIVLGLCALARNGHKVEEVRQSTDGCIVICDMPSDMFSLAGKLVVTFQREADGTSVLADTRIEGQLYDWGKSSRCLNRLFEGIGAGTR